MTCTEGVLSELVWIYPSRFFMLENVEMYLQSQSQRKSGRTILYWHCFTPPLIRTCIHRNNVNDENDCTPVLAFSSLTFIFYTKYKNSEEVSQNTLVDTSSKSPSHITWGMSVFVSIFSIRCLYYIHTYALPLTKTLDLSLLFSCLTEWYFTICFSDNWGTSWWYKLHHHCSWSYVASETYMIVLPNVLTGDNAKLTAIELWMAAFVTLSSLLKQ